MEKCHIQDTVTHLCTSNTGFLLIALPDSKLFCSVFGAQQLEQCFISGNQLKHII